MSYIAPIVGSIVVYHAGRDEQEGGHAPHPAIVNSVDTTGSSQSVTLTAFFSNGLTGLRRGVRHRRRVEADAAGANVADQEAAFWQWPGAGQSDAVAMEG